MKTKIYPIKEVPNKINILRSPYSLQLSIVCATLANGTSTIKNVVKSGAINSTISWCESVGAKIKRVDNDLIIEGTATNEKVKLEDKKLKFSNRLFVSYNSTTPKILIPVLSTINQPFGLKIEENVNSEVLDYIDLFKSLGIECYVEDDIFRIEKSPVVGDYEIDGDTDLHIMAGIFIALAFIKGSNNKKECSTVSLKAN